MRERLAEEVVGVAGLRHDVETRLGEQPRDALAQQHVVLADHDPQRFRHTSRLSRRWSPGKWRTHRDDSATEALNRQGDDQARRSGARPSARRRRRRHGRSARRPQHRRELQVSSTRGAQGSAASSRASVAPSPSGSITSTSIAGGRSSAAAARQSCNARRFPGDGEPAVGKDPARKGAEHLVVVDYQH